MSNIKILQYSLSVYNVSSCRMDTSPDILTCALKKKTSKKTTLHGLSIIF